MNSKQSLKVLLIAVLGVVAVLALPAIASAKAPDRNHDGIPDRWEKRHHLSLRVDQAQRNQDGEGLDNGEEFEAGTNPREADTDEDGTSDAQEVESGDDPLSSDDSHACDDHEGETEARATAGDDQQEGAEDEEVEEEEEDASESD